MPKDQASNSPAVTKPDTQRCVLCAHPDPQVRTAHHKQIVANINNDEQGLLVLHAHLTQEWVTLREPEKQRPDLVEDVVAFLKRARLEEQKTALTTDTQVHEHIAAILAMLETKMDMRRRFARRLSDLYPETNATPGLYTKMSEEEYQKRRAILLAQMAEIAHQEAVDSTELSNGDEV